ncbi:hypothetical protein [uncultured Sphingobacterium sp.]|uniref:hypothetical protein n=1 Tax=uncultured Sphingobacterium sp. TaxID=182688 RepID=UPI0037493E8A
MGESGLTRLPINLIGTWTDNEFLKDAPSNGLGLLGLGGNPEASQKMQLLGVFGLSRTNLINLITKPQNWRTIEQAGLNIIRSHKNAIEEYYNKLL